MVAHDQESVYSLDRPRHHVQVSFLSSFVAEPASPEHREEGHELLTSPLSLHDWANLVLIYYTTPQSHQCRTEHWFDRHHHLLDRRPLQAHARGYLHHQPVGLS